MKENKTRVLKRILCLVLSCCLLMGILPVRALSITPDSASTSMPDSAVTKESSQISPDESSQDEISAEQTPKEDAASSQTQTDPAANKTEEASQQPSAGSASPAMAAQSSQDWIVSLDVSDPTNIEHKCLEIGPEYSGKTIRIKQQYAMGSNCDIPIVVLPGTVDTTIILDNVCIANPYERLKGNVRSDMSCLTIYGNTDVTLEIPTGTTTNLTAGHYGKSGIDLMQCPGQSEPNVTITGGGTLNAVSTLRGSGINTIATNEECESRSTLNITGDVTVNATGDQKSPGIGIAYTEVKHDGNVRTQINVTGNAKVNATGGTYAAGIGGCYELGVVAFSKKANHFPKINVNIGDQATVEAHGGYGGAGIGLGDSNGSSNPSDFNDAFPQATVTVYGNATVNAYGGYQAAGIGCGKNNFSRFANKASSSQTYIKDTATVNAYAGQYKLNEHCNTCAAPMGNGFYKGAFPTSSTLEVASTATVFGVSTIDGQYTDQMSSSITDSKKLTSISRKGKIEQNIPSTNYDRTMHITRDDNQYSNSFSLPANSFSYFIMLPDTTQSGHNFSLDVQNNSAGTFGMIQCENARFFPVQNIDLNVLPVASIDTSFTAKKDYCNNYVNSLSKDQTLELPFSQTIASGWTVTQVNLSSSNSNIATVNNKTLTGHGGSGSASIKIKESTCVFSKPGLPDITGTLTNPAGSEVCKVVSESIPYDCNIDLSTCSRTNRIVSLGSEYNGKTIRIWQSNKESSNSNVGIVVESGVNATIILDNVDITNPYTILNGFKMANSGIAISGGANVTLEIPYGTTSNLNSQKSGISLTQASANNQTNLTITGGGTLNVTGGENNSGINTIKAANDCTPRSDLTIAGDVCVNAIGGNNAPGIGIGYAQNDYDGNIRSTINIIENAKVSSTGGTYAAGIGSCYQLGVNVFNAKQNHYSKLNINIGDSADVEARGGYGGAGIGFGDTNGANNYIDCNDGFPVANVNIYGNSKVSAYGGYNAAGIGCGKNNYSRVGSNRNSFEASIKDNARVVAYAGQYKTDEKYVTCASPIGYGFSNSSYNSKAALNVAPTATVIGCSAVDGQTDGSNINSMVSKRSLNSISYENILEYSVPSTNYDRKMYLSRDDGQYSESFDFPANSCSYSILLPQNVRSGHTFSLDAVNANGGNLNMVSQNNSGYFDFVYKDVSELTAIYPVNNVASVQPVTAQKNVSGTIHLPKGSSSQTLFHTGNPSTGWQVKQVNVSSNNQAVASIHGTAATGTGGDGYASIVMNSNTCTVSKPGLPDMVIPIAGNVGDEVCKVISGSDALFDLTYQDANIDSSYAGKNVYVYQSSPLTASGHTIYIHNTDETNPINVTLNNIWINSRTGSTQAPLTMEGTSVNLSLQGTSSIGTMQPKQAAITAKCNLTMTTAPASKANLTALSVNSTAIEGIDVSIAANEGGSLTLTAASSGAEANGAPAIRCRKSMALGENTYVTATANSNNSNAVVVNDKLTLSHGAQLQATGVKSGIQAYALTATGSNTKLTSIGNEYGIYVDDNIQFTNGATVNAEAIESQAIYICGNKGNPSTIEQATVTAQCKKGEGIFVNELSELAIKDQSDVTISSNKAALDGRKYNISIEGGMVKAYVNNATALSATDVTGGTVVCFSKAKQCESYLKDSSLPMINHTISGLETNKDYNLVIKNLGTKEEIKASMLAGYLSYSIILPQPGEYEISFTDSHGNTYQAVDPTTNQSIFSTNNQNPSSFTEVTATQDFKS